MGKPKASKELVVKLATEEWARIRGGKMPEYYAFAVRGYRATTMGPTPGNDPGIWDDAMFFVGPDIFLAEDANTDPSRYGWNAHADKPMAVLDPGIWPFRRGPHKGHSPALRQMTEEEAETFKASNGGRFSVTRTYAPGDKRNYKEAGYFAINVHPGGINGTSSEGCQTLPRDRSDQFLQKVWDLTRAAKQDVIEYILVTGPIL